MNKNNFFVQWYQSCWGHSEGGVGSGKCLDRGGGGFSRYPVWYQVGHRNRNRLPWSQDTPEADGDEGGGPLQGFPWPPKSLWWPISVLLHEYLGGVWHQTVNIEGSASLMGIPIDGGLHMNILWHPLLRLAWGHLGRPYLQQHFNMVMDSGIWNWVMLVTEKEACQEGLDWLSSGSRFFYAYDGLLVSPRPARFQAELKVMTVLFDRVGLRTKINNTVEMVCQNCRMAYIQLEADYKSRMQEIHRKWVRCP